MASIALALLAALLFATAATLQHSAARSSALRADTAGAGTLARLLPVIPLLRGLAGNPWWLAGVAANILGFAVHAFALHLGSITIVQAVLVVQVIFALPLATLRRRRLPLARDWWGTGAVCAGLIMLVVLRGPVEQTTERRGMAPIVAAVVVCFIVSLVLAGRRLRRRVQTRTALIGVAAGSCFSLTATFVVYVGAGRGGGGPAGIIDWPLGCVAVSTLLSSLLVQDAYASGSLPTAMTAMTVADPAMSWLVGLVLFDVDPPHSLYTLAGCLAAGITVAIGVALLVNSPTVHDERDREFGDRSALPARAGVDQLP